MHKTCIALVIGTMAVAPAVASAASGVMSAVSQFVDGFNKGDGKMLASACADETSIIDEFTPYEWHGKGACTNWWRAYVADAKKNGITEGHVTLFTPSHIDVVEDRAYVVALADYAYKAKGKSMKEVGSTFTVALRKDTNGWFVVGWAWSKH